MPHRRREELAAEHGPPPMELDYSFLKADGPVVESGAGEALHTTLSFWDESTQMGLAFSLPSKTECLDYVVTCVDQFASSLGHRRIRLRTDGEPSILKVARHFRELRNDTSLEQAPRYRSQSL